MLAAHDVGLGQASIRAEKGVNFKDGLLLHSTCGAFISLMVDLKDKIPSEDYAACVPRVEKDFMNGLFDPEIHKLLETSVPPIELTSVSWLRRLCIYPKSDVVVN